MRMTILRFVRNAGWGALGFVIVTQRCRMQPGPSREAHVSFVFGRIAWTALTRSGTGFSGKSRANGPLGVPARATADTDQTSAKSECSVFIGGRGDGEGLNANPANVPRAQRVAFCGICEDRE